jgi:hypothetical protein
MRKGVARQYLRCSKNPQQVEIIGFEFFFHNYYQPDDAALDMHPGRWRGRHAEFGRIRGSLKEINPDLLHGRRSERNTAPKPLHASRVANSPPAQEVGHREAGKIAYLNEPYLGGIAALQEMGIGKERNGNMDAPAPVGRPSKRLV